MVHKKTEQFTEILSQRGKITVVNSTETQGQVYPGQFAQLIVYEEHDEGFCSYVYLPDAAIDELIEALQAAKSKPAEAKEQ